jgi:hypothetical protein
MLNYSELTKPQKRVIDLMKQGNELRLYYKENKFLFNGELGTSPNRMTVNSLYLRGFIKECFRDKDIAVYCLNVEIQGIPQEIKC